MDMEIQNGERNPVSQKGRWKSGKNHDGSSVQYSISGKTEDLGDDVEEQVDTFVSKELNLSGETAKEIIFS